MKNTGTCCGAHLQTKVRDYAKNAQNGAVTVTIIENPKIDLIIDPSMTTAMFSTSGQNVKYVPTGNCDYCSAPAEFIVTYFPKREKEE